MNFRPELGMNEILEDVIGKLSSKYKQKTSQTHKRLIIVFLKSHSMSNWTLNIIEPVV